MIHLNNIEKTSVLLTGLLGAGYLASSYAGYAKTASVFGYAALTTGALTAVEMLYGHALPAGYHLDSVDAYVGGQVGGNDVSGSLNDAVVNAAAYLHVDFAFLALDAVI